MIELDETFDRDFDCKPLSELPSNGRNRYYFPGGIAEGGRDGLIVQVRPQVAGPWLGIFAFGDSIPKAKSGLYTWPDPRVLCAVSRGDGYTVRTDLPAENAVISIYPIFEVIPIAAHRIVVFGNYTELVAYGESGVVWESGRLAWDGFNVTAVTDEYIEGKAWDPGVERDVRFRVDLKDGRHEPFS